MEKNCNNICTVKNIAKVWMIKGWNVVKKENKNEEELVQYITKKFQYILKKIWCEEETFRSISKSGGNGHFNFKCKNGETPIIIKKIFDMFEEKGGMYTSDEIAELEDMLAKIMVTNKQKRKKDCLDKDIKRKGLQKYYIDNKGSDFFEKRIFVKIKVENHKPTKAVRYKFYQDQYDLIKKWNNKWTFIMNKAKMLRVNERVYFGYLLKIDEEMAFSDREVFYKTGKGLLPKYEESYLKYDRITKESLYESCLSLYEKESNYANKETTELNNIDYVRCCRKCSELVEEVLKLQLKDISETDYDYIKRKAFEDLEILHEQMVAVVKLLKEPEPKEDLDRLKEEKYARYYCREVANIFGNDEINQEDCQKFLNIKEAIFMQKEQMCFELSPDDDVKALYYKIRSPL